MNQARIHAFPLAALLLAAFAAPPAHAQETVPESARYYLSQGEWIGVALTPGGRAILAQVAHAAAAGPVTSIDINGLADLAPTPASQQRLTTARLAATRAELMRDGIQAAAIAVQPAGGTVPAAQPHQVIVVVHY